MTAAAEDWAELPRRERRKREVRARIAGAALELFDENGFAATTVVQICERADVAHKTFFNHFPSKQHVLRDVAQDYLDRLLVMVEEARKYPGSARARLEYFFKCVADRAEENPMQRELVTEVVHVAHEMGTEREQAETLRDAFGAMIREGVASGQLTRKHSIQTQTEMLLGAYYALMFNWANLEDYPLRRQARAGARLLADALCTSNGRSTA